MVAHSNLSHSGGRAFEITPQLHPVVFSWWLITVTDGAHPGSPAPLLGEEEEVTHCMPSAGSALEQDGNVLKHFIID